MVSMVMFRIRRSRGSYRRDAVRSMLSMCQRVKSGVDWRGSDEPMPTKINRRDFMATTAAAGLAAAAAPLSASGPTMMMQSSFKPIVVGSENGFKFKNGGTKTGIEIAFQK